MGRGSYTSLSITRSSSRLSRFNSDVQRFLDHPKPKSWLNALSDHPALTPKVQDEETKKLLLHIVPEKELLITTTPNLRKEIVREVEAFVSPTEKQEDVFADDDA